MDTANYNLELKNGWKFYLGEIDVVEEIPVMMSDETSKAGGSLKELDMFGKTVVHVNGVEVARNVSGYNRFSCEIGDYLLPGAENNIALYVDARRWEGWWYEGAGLYRPVYIEFRIGTGR